MGRYASLNHNMYIAADPTTVDIVHVAHSWYCIVSPKCLLNESRRPTPFKSDRFCSTERPIDGVWSIWDDWTDCSSECGGGEQTRSRQCNDPALRAGGAHCVGRDHESRDCNTFLCPGEHCHTSPPPP